jgi:hypothetical protein
MYIAARLLAQWVAFATGVLFAANTAAEMPVQLVVLPAVPTPNDRVTLRVSPRPPSSRSPLFVLQDWGDGRRIDPLFFMGRDLHFGDAEISVDVGALAAGHYFAQFFDDYSDFRHGDSALEVRITVTESGPVTVVEFFNAGKGHYFMTSDPGEIATLDNGVQRGWARTGETLRTFPLDAVGWNAQPVCRFYGLPEAGLDSHFYASDAAECAAVKARWSDRWVLETEQAFAVGRRESVYDDYDYDYDHKYDCEAGQQPVYRLYNNRPDANHRYTTTPRIRDEMIAAGWILEGRAGSSPERVFAMCAMP